MTTFAELDEMVPAYDELYRLDAQLTQDWYPRRVISLARGGSLLELGVGHGTANATFSQHFSHCQVVVEGSAEMIKLFRIRFDLQHVDVQRAFFEDFDTEERLDHISLGSGLESVQDADGVLRRFRRFLKPDGLLFIAVPNLESLHRRFGQAAGLLPTQDLLSESDHRLGHARYFSLET